MCEQTAHESYHLTVLETTSSRPRCPQDCFPGGYEGASILGLSPTFWWFAGKLWCSLASARHPISTFSLMWHSSSVHASAPKRLLLMRTPVLLD